MQYITNQCTLTKQYKGYKNVIKNIWPQTIQNQIECNLNISDVYSLIVMLRSAKRGGCINLRDQEYFQNKPFKTF